MGDNFILFNDFPCAGFKRPDSAKSAFGFKFFNDSEHGGSGLIEHFGQLFNANSLIPSNLI